ESPGDGRGWLRGGRAHQDGSACRFASAGPALYRTLSMLTDVYTGMQTGLLRRPQSGMWPSRPQGGSGLGADVDGVLRRALSRVVEELHHTGLAVDQGSAQHGEV